MTTTDRSAVLSVFENETQVQQAMDDLQRIGISSDRIRYYVRKSGTAITDLLERLGLPEQEASFYNEEFEADHPVVMVNAGERQQEVYDLLYRNGGYDMKTRDAHIRDYGSIATSGTKGEQRLKLREELLRVQKQPIETVSGAGGRVRQTKQATYQLVPFPQAQREIAVALRLTEHRLRRSSQPVWARLSMRTKSCRHIAREGTSWCSLMMWMSFCRWSMRWRSKRFPWNTWCGQPIAKQPGRSTRRSEPFRISPPLK